MLGARQLVRTGPTPSLVINLESLGYFRDGPGTQHAIPDISIGHRKLAAAINDDGSRANFVLVACRPNSSQPASLIEHHLVDAGVITYLLEDKRWNGAGQKITARLNPVGLSFDRSDHAPFWRAQIPALVLSDTALARNPNYHRPTDTPDTLDYDRMVSICRALAAAVQVMD